MAAVLTANAIAAVNGGDLDLKPVMQVLDLKLYNYRDKKTYQMTVSDGSSTQKALLAMELTSFVRKQRLQKGSVVQLLEYRVSNSLRRRLILVLKLETVLQNCEVIGNPNLTPEAESSGRVPSLKNPRYPGGESLNSTASVSAPPARINAKSAMNTTNNVANFQGTVQPSYRPPPSYINQGPIIKNEDPARIIPIAALSPYLGRWTIKARVTSKGDLRRYINAMGDWKVYSFDLLDSNGGEIRATCFNDVVDRFYDTIEPGKVYMIANGSLKPARRNFNHLNNEWEIFLDATSTVKLCPDEDSSIPAQQFNFRRINEIKSAKNNSIVDIIGIITRVNPSATILMKNGMKTQRRILNLRDVSCPSVELTLFGDFCNREGRQLQKMLDSGEFPVLAVKAGKVNDFSGKSVRTISVTQLFINPDLPESCSLWDWFFGGEKNFTSQSISRDVMPGLPWNGICKTVSQIKEGLWRGGIPNWVTVKATLSFIKTDSFCYTACPRIIGDCGGQCWKKVTKLDNGNWYCERCNRELEECEYRYLFEAQLQDHTGLIWVTAFQESGEEMLSCSAKELYMLKFKESDDTKFREMVRRNLFEQFLCRLKIKEELYGDEQRLKITVVKAQKVNTSVESTFLLDSISKLSLRR